MVAHVDLAGYFLPVRVRQTAATAAVATIWTMRNTHATKSALIKSIDLNLGGDSGVGGIAAYELCRFSAATPTGGSALTPIEMRTSSTFVSCITDARQVDTGLTVAGVTFETAFAALQHGGSLAGPTRLQLTMLDNARTWSGFELSPGEGLAIRLVATAVIGQVIAGYVFWDERL